MRRQASNWTGSINRPEDHPEIRRLRRTTTSVGPEYLLCRIVAFCTDADTGGAVNLGDMREIFSMVSRQTLAVYIGKLIECGALVQQKAHYICTVAQRICAKFSKNRKKIYEDETPDLAPNTATGSENEANPWDAYLHKHDVSHALNADTSADEPEEQSADEVRAMLREQFPGANAPPPAPKPAPPASAPKHAWLTDKLQFDFGVKKRPHEIAQLWQAAGGRQDVMNASLAATYNKRGAIDEAKIAGYLYRTAQRLGRAFAVP